MNVNLLSNDKMIINLTKEEVDLLFGGYDSIDYNDPKSRKTINMLFEQAFSDGEFELDCEKLLIEVRPESDGCSITFSKLHRTAAVKAKKFLGTDNVFIFPDSESMIKGAMELKKATKNKISKSLLYRFKDKYSLLLNIPETSDNFSARMDEFCDEIFIGNNAAAAATEYGKLICDNPAIEKITDAFKEI